MSLAYWCVLIAGIMPILTVVIAKLQPGFNNRDPRAWLDMQQGMRRRAEYAHRNHFEAFPFFAAAVIIAQQLNAPQISVDTLAAVFIVARIAFTLFYLADRPTLRSIAFVIGYGCILGLFFLSAFRT